MPPGLLAQARRQEMKWGGCKSGKCFFFEKNGKWGCFGGKWKMGVFCKKVDVCSTQGAFCVTSIERRSCLCFYV